MDTPLVSVITPTWQRHDLLLSRCLPSVRAQDYPAVEHVVVCDGPDPDLAAAIGGQVKVFDQLPEHYPSTRWGARARLRGLDLAEGDLITYLDDDDAFRPQHCAVLAAALAASPEADFAYSLMSSQGAIIGSVPPSFCNIGTPMIMHRRETLRLGTWGPESAAEDWELVERWLHAGAKFAHVPDVTVDVYPSGSR